MIYFSSDINESKEVKEMLYDLLVDILISQNEESEEGEKLSS